MKKVTFSVEEQLIKKAREVARAQNRTLNAAFREWLVDFTEPARNAEQFTVLMKRLRQHVRAKPPYTRDEMNER
jgi:hypothetical protein